MKRNLFITVASVAVAAGAMLALPSVSAAQAPPMGGGYTNVIPIPHDSPDARSSRPRISGPDRRGDA